MRLVRHLDDLHISPQGCVATIGNFDGLHLGHQAILERVTARAKALGIASCVMMFEPQPQEFLNPQKAPIRLTCWREKLEWLKKYNIDIVLCLAFNQRIKTLTAAAFIDHILVEALHVKHLEIGDDFHFGAGRRGDFSLLCQAGAHYGFTVEEAKTVFLDHQRISSTRVRQAVANADFNLAERLLGRPFRLTGKVIKGQQLARQLGFPTANVQLNRKKAPLQGVYTVSCVVEGKMCYGVANIGVRPTVKGDGKPHLEVHLLDFEDNLYNHYLRVVFHHKLRDEKRFNSLDELKAAINNDVNNAQAYWKAKGVLNQ